MPYLFENQVNDALRRRPDDQNLLYLRQQCQDATRKLEVSKARPDGAYARDDQTAKALAFTMGEKTRRDRKNPDAPHASSYVGNWRMVSDNYGTVRDKVIAELGHAYDLGLDIRSDEVLGAMYILATSVFSEIDNYSSPTQEEGRR